MRARTFLSLFVVIVLITAPLTADPLLWVSALQGAKILHQSQHLKFWNQGTIIKQTSEITCGPAATASLLRSYFGEDTSEKEIAELSKTYEKGATLLGLREACRAKGYEAKGYRMTLSQLFREIETSGIPVLVHFQRPFLHYVLVVGRIDDFVLVSDPGIGDRAMDIGEFLRRWDNTVLVVMSSHPGRSDLTKARKESTKTRLQSLHHFRAASSFRPF